MLRILNNQIVQCLAGALLLGIGAVAAFFWFFWLIPSSRRFDPNWEKQFTRKALWQQIENDIRRYGWSHDDSGYVGMYGDKSWAEWIMGKAEAGQAIANCGDIGHKDAALKSITCTDPASGTNWNTEPQWLAWWSTNKDKPQLEWIKSGLLNYGVVVHLPPNEQDYEPLLALLGNSVTNPTGKIPRFVKYNAFRWLRDSGFQVLPFAMSNVTAQTPPFVRDGIILYGKYEHAFPKNDSPGILPLIETPPASDNGLAPPLIKRLAVQLSACIVVLLLCTAGIFLLRRSFRQNNCPVANF
jgi:hypothetical protein